MPPRILIVKTSALGDIVHCFHVAKYIKQCIPNAFLGWIAEKQFAELVYAHTDVDKVFTIDTKRWKQNPFSRETWTEIKALRQELREKEFDLVLDLQGNVKSAIVTSLVRSRRKVGFAAPYVKERISTLTTHERFLPPSGKNVRDDYLFLAQQAISGPCSTSVEIPSVTLKITEQQLHSNEDFLLSLPEVYSRKALVFPGAAWKNKQLSELDLAAFLQLFERHTGMGILLAWGSQEEHALVNRIKDRLNNARVITRLPLPQLQNLMGKCELVLAMDSLPLHLAATVQVPTFSFFGPSEALKYAPEGSHHGHFQGTCPYGINFTRRCPKLRTCSTGKCLRELDVNAVFNQFKNWWDLQLQ